MALKGPLGYIGDLKSDLNLESYPYGLRCWVLHLSSRLISRVHAVDDTNPASPHNKEYATLRIVKGPL